MTPTEYRTSIERLGLSQVGASRLFGVDPRTSRRWALGELPVPRAVALCLRIAERLGATKDDLDEIMRDQ